MAEIIAVANHKGGVAKTTSVVNIGSRLADLKKDVLLIDCDPQSHLTKSFMWDESEKHESIYNIYKTGEMFYKSVNNSENLNIITSNLDLSHFEIDASREFKRETILSRMFKGLDSMFDYIILDCPPNLGLITVNVLCFADHILIPLTPEILPVDGLTSLFRMLDLVKKELNPDLNILGIFLARADMRLKLSKNIKEFMEEDYQSTLMESFIRHNVSVAEAPLKRTDIFSYKPDSAGAEDYKKLTDELLKRLERKK